MRMLINEKITTGHHKIQWDGTNDSGVAVANGLYIYQMVAGSYFETKKMVLMR